jgi:ribosomal protein S18 acetylase RimI-like enzyme
MMAPVPVRVRPATPEDPGAPLLYASAAGYYDRFAEDEGGEVVGLLAGFAVADAEPLVHGFVRLALPRVRPWRLPGTLAHLRAAARVSPVPPAHAWYVDALAVAPAARRRGVARTLLDAAEARARAAGTPVLALDTGLENTDAQRLYHATGFTERARTHAPDARTARALGGPGFVSYVRTV